MFYLRNFVDQEAGIGEEAFVPSVCTLADNDVEAWFGKGDEDIKTYNITDEGQFIKGSPYAIATYMPSETGDVNICSPDMVYYRWSSTYREKGEFERHTIVEKLPMKRLESREIEFLFKNGEVNGLGGLNNIVFVKLKNGVKSIAAGAFNNSPNLISVDGPEVETIKDLAFAGCGLDARVEFENVKSVGGQAFRDCLNVRYMHFPKLNKIGSYAFADNQNLRAVYVNNMNAVELDNVEEMGEGAFKNCSRITNVSLKLEEVPASAFENCTRLTNVNLNGMASVIGKRAFANTGLQNFEFGNRQWIYSSAFENCGFTSLDFTDKIIHVEANAFSGCTSINEISISYANYYSEDAFVGCPNVNVLNIDWRGLLEKDSIDFKAFRKLTSLKEINFGDKVTQMNWACLSGFTNLETVRVGDSCEQIAGDMFSGSNIKDFYFGSGLERITGDILGGTDGICTFHYNGTKEMWNNIYKSDEHASAGLWYKSAVKVRLICDDFDDYIIDKPIDTVLGEDD